MALFKSLRGKRENLPSTKTDGYAYFCTDDGTFWIDYKDENNVVQRKQLNAKEAELLSGVSLTELQDGINDKANKSHTHAIADVTDLQSTLNNKVDKISGKGLSTNDLTSTLKTNYDKAYTHSTTAHAPSNAERNAIVGIQKNGSDVSIDSSTRKVNITVPTKVSDLTNDSGFITSSTTTEYTDTEIQTIWDGIFT